MSQIIRDIADEIASTFASVTLTPQLTTYVWSPVELTGLPCVVIEPPDINFLDIEQDGTQLGSYDWNLTYPACFYFEITEAGFTQQQATEYIEAAVKALQTNAGLNGQAVDAKITEAIVKYVEDQPRPLLCYECKVGVLRFES